MSDNTAQARKKLEGHREAVRDATRKWHRYTETYEKDGQWRTIQNAQRHIQRIKNDHPSLGLSDRADSWRPGDLSL